MKTVAFHNLGCKVNSVEADIMQQNLQKHGYKIVDFQQKADYFIINTCSVTNIADRKSRQMLHRARTLNPDAVVVAVGCYVQADAFHIAQDEAVDLLIGNNRKADLAAILEEYEEHKTYDGGYQREWNRFTVPGIEAEERPEELKAEIKKFLVKTLGNTTIADVRKEEYEEALKTETTEHTRAFIKIQDGCNRFCSYCIIPYTRGRIRSRKQEDVLKEVSLLAGKGFREFVLTGIHISSYGLDRGSEPGRELVELIKGINNTAGVDRIRIGSFEPVMIEESFVNSLAECDKLCPHFHLSLQSGCDETLKRMNRRYTSGEYLEKVRLLRNAFPEAAITTDIIVGFPGETEEEFRKTKAFLEEVNFYEMHIFKFSPRRGTPAATMDGQVPEELKQERSAALIQLEEKQSKEFRRKFLGRTEKVLFEEKKEIKGEAFWTGHTREYVRIALKSPEDLTNTLTDVAIKDFLTDEVLQAEKA